MLFRKLKLVCISVIKVLDEFKWRKKVELCKRITDTFREKYTGSSFIAHLLSSWSISLIRLLDILSNRTKDMLERNISRLVFLFFILSFHFVFKDKDFSTDISIFFCYNFCAISGNIETKDLTNSRTHAETASVWKCNLKYHLYTKIQKQIDICTFI